MCLVLIKDKSVQNLVSKNLIQSFDLETIRYLDKFLDTQSVILTDLYQTLGAGKEVGVSIYSGCVLIKQIPIALGLEEDVIKQQLYWETEQFIISSLDDYIVEYQRLPFQTLTGNPLYVVVLIRKKILSIIKQLVKKAGMVLRDVDVDVFSNIRSLVENYQLSEEINVLIDVQREYICIIFIKDEEFYLSHIISLKNNKSTLISSAEINNLLLKELKRLIFGHRIVNKIEDISIIYLTGIAVVHKIMVKLSEEIEVPIEILNPFSKIAVSQSVSDRNVLKENPEKFTPSIGVALKKFR